MRIAFVHPDLGIGGAEQLVVNAALAMQQKGHQVTIYTAHHDRTHCFQETKGDGPLSAHIRVHGDWLPRHIFWKMHALCAYIRMIYVALVVVLTASYDVIFTDQVSVHIPVLRLSRTPVLFYCHFPDKLLCVDRSSLAKRLYRGVLDYVEETTTGMASRVLVNSAFTGRTFRSAFPRLSALPLDVLYPSVKLTDRQSVEEMSAPLADGAPLTLLSINRFERKKNIGLAVRALAGLRQRLPAEQYQRVDLVLAGGYDPLVVENVEHFAELQQLAQAEGVADSVRFRPNFSDAERDELLRGCVAVVYTPANEHFGIVPIEAMYGCRPVIAVASGGPLESVKDGETGYLREGEPQAFTEAMELILSDPQKARAMGVAGRAHVIDNFSMPAFAARLNAAVHQLAGLSLPATDGATDAAAGAAGAAAAAPSGLRRRQ